MNIRETRYVKAYNSERKAMFFMKLTRASKQFNKDYLEQQRATIDDIGVIYGEWKNGIVGDVEFYGTTDFKQALKAMNFWGYTKVEETTKKEFDKLENLGQSDFSRWIKMEKE